MVYEFLLAMRKKCVIVTGGTTGIGKATAILLKKHGYDVVATYKTNDQEANQFKIDTGIETKRFDISDYLECQKNINEIIKDYGQIHCLINNAGVIKDKMLHKMTLEEWKFVLDINLTGVFNMCRNVIEHMRENSFGRIVNISSVNGIAGQIGQCNYAATKAGIIGFSKSLAKESASKNITVNCIAPGYVETDMTKTIKPEIKQMILEQIPLKRFATPEEIANGILFLLENSYMTGSVLSLNGGLYI